MPALIETQCQYFKREKEKLHSEMCDFALYIPKYNTKRGDFIKRLQKGGESQSSDAAKNMAVCTYVVIQVKQFASVGFIVEVVGKVSYHSFNVVAIIDNYRTKSSSPSHSALLVSSKLLRESVNTISIGVLMLLKQSTSQYKHIAFANSIEIIICI